MIRDECDKILEYINKDTIMLEWGSGGSTTYFPQFVKLYLSIEHDKYWFDLVKMAQPDNCELYWVKNNLPRTIPSKREQFKDYVEYVNHLGIEHFDAVLIDGRARVACAKEVVPYINQKSVVFLHDCQRNEYKEIYTIYEQVDRAGVLSVMRLRE